MTAQLLHKTSFWLAISASMLVPLVPLAFAWFDPPRPLKAENGVIGLAGFGLDLLSGMGRGAKIGVITVSIAAFAVLVSLLAFVAARYANLPASTQWLCGLPVLLILLGMLVITSMG